jgi:hypothetical protein
MFVFIGMAALAVDMSFAYVLRNNLQGTSKNPCPQA